MHYIVRGIQGFSKGPVGFKDIFRLSASIFTPCQESEDKDFPSHKCLFPTLQKEVISLTHLELPWGIKKPGHQTKVQFKILL